MDSSAHGLPNGGSGKKRGEDVGFLSGGRVLAGERSRNEEGGGVTQKKKKSQKEQKKENQ